MNVKKYKYMHGEKFYPITPRGPVSAGWVCSGSAFTPIGETEEAAVFTRIWDEAYMYPGFDMGKPAVRITEGLGGCCGITAADWNRDGRDDFIITNRTGYINLFEQVRDERGVMLENRGIVRDYKTGNVFNIQFYHAELGY